MGSELGKRTAPGFGDPDAPSSMARATEAADQGQAQVVSLSADAPAGPVAPVVMSVPAGPPPKAAPGMDPSTQKTPMVELQVRYEHGPPAPKLPERRVLEIWTQNSVYALDTRMRCIEVRAPATGEPIPEHPFVGTRLVGGQWQDEAGVELSYPLPRPGSCAVFEGQRGNKRRFSRTSAVERVVLRLQVVSVTDAGHMPSWAELIEE